MATLVLPQEHIERHKIKNENPNNNALQFVALGDDKFEGSPDGLEILNRIIAKIFKGLFILDKVLYYLLAAAGLAERDVNPVACARWGGLLPDELVELQVVHHPEEPTFASGLVRDVDVGCFSGHVLRVLYTANGFVQGRYTKVSDTFV